MNLDKQDLVILHHTTEYRGDHSAEVAIVIRPRTELVTELVSRLALKSGDWLEIRRVPSENP